MSLMKKNQAPIWWTKHFMITHPTVFVTTIGKVKGKYIHGVAPIATCLDTSLNPPYITFSISKTQHSLVWKNKNSGKTNTYSNIRQNNSFIVNIPDKKMRNMLDKLSFPRLRKDYIDKLKEAGLRTSKAIFLDWIAPPIINDCIAHLECRVVDIHLPKWSDHYQVTGRVVGISYDPRLGLTIDNIKQNLAKNIFHYFWSSETRESRYIGFIETEISENNHNFLMK